MGIPQVPCKCAYLHTPLVLNLLGHASPLVSCQQHALFGVCSVMTMSSVFAGFAAAFAAFAAAACFLAVSVFAFSASVVSAER